MTMGDTIATCARSRYFACVLPVDADGYHAGDHQDAEGHTGHNYGRPDYYEITWQTGHIETVPAHQVTYPHQGLALAAGLSFGLAGEAGAPRVRLHAEIDGRWLLTLSALEEDIRTMRLVTGGEQIPGDPR